MFSLTISFEVAGVPVTGLALCLAINGTSSVNSKITPSFKQQGVSVAIIHVKERSLVT